jgi:hypothetical protein
MFVLEARTNMRRDDDYLLRKKLQSFKLSDKGVVKRSKVEATRPRELPNIATAVLKEWLADNKDSPYPSIEQKNFFAEKTGLSMKQINTWFVNHRGRDKDLKKKKTVEIKAEK